VEREEGGGKEEEKTAPLPQNAERTMEKAHAVNQKKRGEDCARGRKAAQLKCSPRGHIFGVGGGSVFELNIKERGKKSNGGPYLTGVRSSAGIKRGILDCS